MPKNKQFAAAFALANKRYQIYCDRTGKTYYEPDRKKSKISYGIAELKNAKGELLWRFDVDNRIMLEL